MGSLIPPRVIERVLTKVVPVGDCLISTYSRGSHGYAQVGWHDEIGHQKMTLCHIVAWVAQFGSIPEGMTVDHRCRVRPCVNWRHLRLLTNVDNAKDNGNHRKTHCPRGHPYDEENTRWYVTKEGWVARRCRACRRLRR